MTARTNTERQRDLYARRKAQGLVKVCVFAPSDLADVVKAAALVHATRAEEAREALAQMMEKRDEATDDR